MVKPIIGIVSSFDVLCGNATFSEAIAEGLEKFGKVKKIKLHRSLQYRQNLHCIKSVIKEIKECDYVNFQFELGLYGPTPKKSLQNFKKMIDACKSKFSVTMHRIDEKTYDNLRPVYNLVKNLKFKEAIKEIIFTYKRQYLPNIYQKIIQNIYKKKGCVYTHTFREKERVYEHMNNNKIDICMHPICWPDYSHLKLINLDKYFIKKSLIIGLFGFITEYKNFHLPLEALQKSEFNIILCGGTHPLSNYYGKINNENSYIKKLDLIMLNKNFNGRVHIVTGLDDLGFASYMKSVDVVCIPYSETGQSMSGVAPMAIQNAKHVIFSDNFHTEELSKFLDQKPFIFDVLSIISFNSALKDVILDRQKLKFKKGIDFNSQINEYARSLNLV